MGPYTLRIASRSLALVRTGLRQVPVVVEELVESTVVGAQNVPPTGMTAGAVTVEADGLPAAPRLLTRSNFLHTAHTLLKHACAWPCIPHQCTLLLLLLLQQCGTATSSWFWQVFCSSSTSCIDGVSSTYVASDAAFRAAATSPAQPVWTSAPAPLPVLLQESLQQLKDPNPAARHGPRAAVCASGLAGRQQSVIQLERS